MHVFEDLQNESWNTRMKEFVDEMLKQRTYQKEDLIIEFMKQNPDVLVKDIEIRTQLIQDEYTISVGLKHD